jgi:glucoamylase
MTADHIAAVGPATTERWEEQFGLSPSSIGAIIAGLVAAADIARQNGDSASATRWESRADEWRSSLAGRTYTTDGFWGGHRYYERIDPTPDTDPNGPRTIHFNEGDFFAHDVADFGFLDLARLGVVGLDDPNVSTSLAPSSAASDGNSTVQVTMPNGDIYFHRYNHDSYGQSNGDCTGWPSNPNAANRYGRFWPVLSGERGEYELANGRSANVYLQSMADAANDGYFVPEQVWDRADVACFTAGRPTGSAAPLNWAEGQYLRLAQSSAILIEALRDAHRWLDELLSDPRLTLESLASREGRTIRSIRMTLSLAFLAPEIVKAAIEGRLPRGFGLKRLVDLPMAWPDQWRTLALQAPAQA